MNNANCKSDSRTINPEQQNEGNQEIKKTEKGVVTPVSSYKPNKPVLKPKK